MRFYLLFLVISVAQVLGSNTYSQSATLTFRMNNVSIEEVLNSIEDQSEFRFLYNKKMVDVERKVNVLADKRNITEILDNLFQDTEIAYAISDRQIVLHKKDAVLIVQQARRVTGLIKDETGESVIGANVMEKGTTNGTISDVDGKFSLSVGDNAVLQISYLGYVTQEIAVGNRTNLDVTLQEDRQTLEEVVVIGYGTARKVSLTGAVATLKPDEIQNVPTGNLT
ncbi:MAG: carboxypeptidase-like regulatory domain-containing protein, partial [Tannerella sp.]|nr:carboxypeptidase-like regulatory domain-containing protein [Tannerella sp.]